MLIPQTIRQMTVIASVIAVLLFAGFSNLVVAQQDEDAEVPVVVEQSVLAQPEKGNEAEESESGENTPADEIPAPQAEQPEEKKSIELDPANSSVPAQVPVPAKQPVPVKKSPPVKKKSVRPLLFNTVEFKGTISKLPKWASVLARMKAWKGYFKTSDLKKLPSRPGWERLKKNAAGMKPMDRLKAVNKYFNQWPYRLDAANYGQAEYWATPPEFLKKSGDCEDYAIAKFYALKELGFAGDDLRVVAVRDMIRNIGHAILVVYLNDDAYVLDNQTVMVLSHTRYKHYLPQYSVNEKYRWMHVPKSTKPLFKRIKKK